MSVGEPIRVFFIDKPRSPSRHHGLGWRHWIAALPLCCALFATEARAQNVLVVIADDLGVDGVAAYGESPTAGPTPVLDALADSGVLFRNFWTQPVCSPTRASLLTGLHPAEHGLGGVVAPSRPAREIGLDASLPNLASMLAAAGYRNFALGKLADLVVLTLDPFELETMEQPAGLRDVTSALTVVDGEIAYSDGSVVLCQDSSDDGIWFRTRPGCASPAGRGRESSPRRLTRRSARAR